MQSFIGHCCLDVIIQADVVGFCWCWGFVIFPRSSRFIYCASQLWYFQNHCLDVYLTRDGCGVILGSIKCLEANLWIIYKDGHLPLPKRDGCQSLLSDLPCGHKLDIASCSASNCSSARPIVKSCLGKIWHSEHCFPRPHKLLTPGIDRLCLLLEVDIYSFPISPRSSKRRNPLISLIGRFIIEGQAIDTKGYNGISIKFPFWNRPSWWGAFTFQELEGGPRKSARWNWIHAHLTRDIRLTELSRQGIASLLPSPQSLPYKMSI